MGEPLRASWLPEELVERGKKTRLHIEGVRTPILTRLARRRASGMTVTQELPFLRVGAEVMDEQGRRAEIARVALALRDGVPELVMELRYRDPSEHDDQGGGSGVTALPSSDDADDDTEPPRGDATLGYDEAPRPRKQRPSGVIAKPTPMRREDTLVFLTTPEEALREAPLPTMDDWMRERGSELELTWREWKHRLAVSFSIVSRALIAALAVLRTSP